jgi:CelD/BcsL family acetyltransferase involved in cellulose biosynthesis
LHPSSAATAQLSLDRVTDIAAVLPRWSALAERSGNLFATPEWLTCWWRHFGRGDAQLWLASADGEPRVLLPLYVEAGVLRFIGHGHSDVLGPVTEPRFRQAGAAILRQLLEDDRVAWTSFEGHDLPDDVPWATLTGAKVKRRTASPILRLEGLDWDGYLASRSRNFRAQARARERRLAPRGLRVRICDDPAQLERDLDDLFELHLARWGPRDARAVVDRGRTFFREVAAVALERGWLRLCILELDGRPAAALLNFRFGGEEWFYQGGRDPRFAREGPGFVLHLHAIRSAIRDGVRSYRFLRGDELYKRRFASDDAGVVTIVRHCDRP